MMLLRLFAFFMFAASAQAQVLTTSNVQIEWKVVNRFRLFADADDFKRHESAWRQYLIHVDGLGKTEEEEQRFIETTSVIGSEHVLNDRYIPFTRILRTKYNPLGWASGMVDRLCYDSKDRDHSACSGAESYVMPKAHAIEARLTARQSDLLFAEYNCEWRVDDTAVTTVPCDESVNLSLPYPMGATISVNAVGERPIQQFAEVRDLLIVGLGDSFASGEGNPDGPVQFADDQLHRNVYPRRLQNDASGNARWIDELCHRSLYGHQLRAALQIAVENPKAAVTFLGYACSGAEVEDGLLGPQAHMNYVSRGESGAKTITSIKGGSRDAQMFWLLRDLCARKPERDDGFFTCPDGDFRRPVDVVLLSVGGNDIGFTSLVTWATLRDSASAQIASFFGATVSPKDFSRNMQKTLPEAYGRLARALEKAVPLRLAGNVFDSSRVILTSYPDILEDELGKICAAGPEGEDEHDFAANQSLDYFRDWLVVTPQRLTQAHAQLAKLHARMGELAEDHGWSFAGRAYAERAFQGHGFCAQNRKADKDPAEVLVMPCVGKPDPSTRTCETSWLGGDRVWRPYNPKSEHYPYALRQRWVRTFNDAYLLLNQKVTTRSGQIDEQASGAVFAETTGAMHPSAEGHAAMADAILLDLRAKVAELLALSQE